MKVTIGGNRVGSGGKMKAHLHNYFRSTHNLSENWVSSMASGVLYPCFVKPCMRGDVFDIQIGADARTVPTQGPLFGSFKLQVDFYQCPIRLYQALLHNNPTSIALKMNQVKLPKVRIDSVLSEFVHEKNVGEFSKSCLMKYLGVSGLGCLQRGSRAGDTAVREFNAVPMLAYYDIFKNYYANKQEEKAYVIEARTATPPLIGGFKVGDLTYDAGDYAEISNYNEDDAITVTVTTNTALEDIYMRVDNYGIFENINIPNLTKEGCILQAVISTNPQTHVRTATFVFDLVNLQKRFGYDFSYTFINPYKEEQYAGIKLTQFDLKNIDDMRYDILSHHTMGVAFDVNDQNTLPYKANFGYGVANRTACAYPMVGLVLKTYQNDIFNNWLNKNWIEGENSIGELTKVTVVDGKFSMDALNFAKKLYNMLNRVAITDGTYESWQDVMYEEVTQRHIESPVFLGGISQEVTFDEIVQTAPADGDPLGTLGGRGRLEEKGKKGGKIHVRIDEASFIIGIVSLTPRIYYTQGNEFYMTDMQSIDDLHKPGMDGIGFQDLIGERMAWFDTALDEGETTPASRSKIGKLPAWIEYMTSVDRAYGDLAENYGKGYMILNRNYEIDENSSSGIKDATTYVDPQKYNYAFAYTSLDAQNFWVQLRFNVTARRKMSARLIPNV